MACLLNISNNPFSVVQKAIYVPCPTNPAAMKWPARLGKGPTNGHESAVDVSTVLMLASAGSIPWAKSRLTPAPAASFIARAAQLRRAWPVLDIGSTPAPEEVGHALKLLVIFVTRKAFICLVNQELSPTTKDDGVVRFRELQMVVLWLIISSLCYRLSLIHI